MLSVSSPRWVSAFSGADRGRVVRGQWYGIQQHDDGDQCYGHQGSHAEERAPPADVAQRASEQGPDRDAQSQCGFVENNGTVEPAGG